MRETCSIKNTKIKKMISSKNNFYLSEKFFVRNPKTKNMMKKIFFLLAILHTQYSIFHSYSQENTAATTNAEMDEANKLLRQEKFASALPLFQNILKQDANNGDVNFKIGLCYRNSLDEQEKAIPYFRKAITKLSVKYDFYDKRSVFAPADAVYFLAETFLFVNEPDSALRYFYIYQDIYQDYLMQETPINVNRQIIMCINAKMAAKNPRNVKVNNLGNTINTEYAETNPVLTLDNSVLFFASRKPKEEGKEQPKNSENGKYDANIYFSKKGGNGKWETPQAFRYNTEEDEFPLCISADGKTLFFSRYEPKTGGTLMFVTTFENGGWTEPKWIARTRVLMGASVTADNKTLYFSLMSKKNRIDIFKLERKGNDPWGKKQWHKEKNLKMPVNTQYNEVSPYINPNGKTLFFSSNGYKNKGMGGYDIYFSELQNGGKWSSPKSLGYPINTTKDDINYYIASAEKRYYSTINGNKSYDIFEVEGGGFEVENVTAEVVTLTQEMNVAEVLETEKTVEKEVEVVETVEVEKIVEKSVEEINADAMVAQLSPEEIAAKKAADEARQKFVVDSIAAVDERRKQEIIANININELNEKNRNNIVGQVKKYLGAPEEKQTLNSKMIYFDFNSNQLNAAAKTELKSIIEFLQKNKDAKVEIVGHTDAKGAFTANARISNHRAEMVHKYFIDKGIPQTRIIYYGKGNLAPIASNDNDDGRKMNRRVEVNVLK